MADIKRKDGNGRYSAVVEHNGILYLAGQVGDDMSADIAQQTTETLARIESLLTENGSDKEHILSAIVYVNNMEEAKDMNKVWDAWVTPGNEPARACVEAAMFSPACKVEISVVAAKK
jgi:Putative translation initiation inhibitor, yjgF family